MSNKLITRNVIANLFGRTWSIISSYLFIPLYLLFLGEETFGLVTFFATLQVVMGLLGLGLSKTLRRVFASEESKGYSVLEKYRLLRSVELVYYLISVVIILVCFFGANFLSEQWLNLELLDSKIVATTIRMMGLSIAIQLVANMYLGCLFGLERQTLANVYQIVWSFSKNVGVVLILLWLTRDIRFFYLWHIITDIMYLIFLRFTIVKILRKKGSLSWSIRNIKNLKLIWKFALGLMFISLVYAINTQLDKAVISKMLPLVELGAYNSVYSLSHLTSIIASAVAIAVFTRFTRFYTSGDYDKLKDSYLFFNKSVAISIIGLGSFMSVFSPEIMMVWTRNEQIVNLVIKAGPFIVLGSTFLSLQIIPYEFMLAMGNTKVNSVFSMISIPYVIIVTPYLIKLYGLFGASIAWVVQMTIITLIYQYYIHKKYINKNAFKWIIKSIILPMIFALSFAYLSKLIIEKNVDSLFITFIFAILTGGISLLILYIIFDRTILKMIYVYLNNIYKKNIDMRRNL